MPVDWVAEATSVDTRTDLVVVRTGADFGIPDWPLVLRQVADQLTTHDDPAQSR